jgi:hypothetical protein
MPLRLMMREPTKLVAACHCLACQRRTGTSFSVNAFYATDTVEVSGTARSSFALPTAAVMYACILPDLWFDSRLEA